MDTMEFERRCWAEVDLGALRHNFKLVRERAGDAAVMAVVRPMHRPRRRGGGPASGAGGRGPVCGVRLWRGGVPAPGGRYKPILILGYTGVQNAAALAVGGISQTVFSLEYARALSEAALRAGVAVRVHLKVDTGMGRIGFTADDDMERAVAEMAEACALPGLVPVGVFTHFAAADSTAPEDIAYTRRQYDILCAAVEEMAARGCTFAVKHCRNSAGTFAWPEFHLDMVRPGIILYGEQPSADTVLPGLVPALRSRAAVSMVKELAAGDAVSYGCTFRAPKPMRAATAGRGLRGRLSAGAVGPGHGLAARQAGAGVGPVCMDQIVVDVTDIPDVKAGDAAIVFGGGAADSVNDVARMTGTINYEVLCDVGRRVQRVYVENGAEVELVDHLKGNRRCGRLFVVIDYQNDFVTGALGNPAAAALEPGIAARVAAQLERGGRVLFTRDTHGTDYLNTREGRFLPVAHCIKGSQGWGLYGSLSQYETGVRDGVSIVGQAHSAARALPAGRRRCAARAGQH